MTAEIKLERLSAMDFLYDLEEELNEVKTSTKDEVKPEVKFEFKDLSHLFSGDATYKEDKQLLVNYINMGGTFNTQSDLGFFRSIADQCNYNEKVMYLYGVNSKYYEDKNNWNKNHWNEEQTITRHIRDAIEIAKRFNTPVNPFADWGDNKEEKNIVKKIEEPVIQLKVEEPLLTPSEPVVNEIPNNPIKEVVAKAKASKPAKRANVVESLVHQLKKKYRIIYYTGAFYLYENGCYIRMSEDRFLGFIKSELPYENKEPAIVRNIYASLRMELDILVEENKERIDPRIEPKDWICFKNCLYNPFTRETKSHTPDLIFFSRVPYNYNPNAEEHQLTMDMFDNFTKGYSESSKELFLELLYQTIGVTLSSIRPKNFFFFSGIKDTGKSTICGLIQRLLGSDNCSAVPIELMSESGFHLSTMIGKKANISPETANIALRENQINLLKKVTGGENDTIHIDIKGISPQNVVLRTMLIFGGNNLPEIWGNGDMEPFVKRMINVAFRGQIQEKDKIHDLLDKIDYEYIIRMAMESLTRFIDNNYVFTTPPEVEENRQRMLNADPVNGFLELCDLSDPTYKISGKKLYECFMLFKERNSYSDNITSNTFTSKLKVKGYEKKSVRVDKTEGIASPIKGFVGIKPPADYSDVKPMILPFDQLAPKA